MAEFMQQIIIAVASAAAGAVITVVVTRLISSPKAKKLEQKNRQQNNRDLELENENLKRQLADCRNKCSEIEARLLNDIDSPLTVSPKGFCYDAAQPVENRVLYCGGCYYKLKRRAPLAETGGSWNFKRYECQECGTKFKIEDETSRKKRAT